MSTTQSENAVRGLVVEAEGPVARITLDRPESRNALSSEVIAGLAAAIDRIGADRAIRVVVLGATGPVFSSGHDLRELAGVGRAEAEALFESCTRMMLGLRRLPQPVIARVQGHAVAAGCQLAATCDLVVAAEGATFSTPGVKIGLFCATPMVPLVRTAPPRAALEMLLTGQSITAERAREIGLVNRVVPAADLDAAVAEFVDAILASSPLTLSLGKSAFYEGLHLPEPDAYLLATRHMIENVGLADAQEGIAAFLQKRKPEWKGE